MIAAPTARPPMFHRKWVETYIEIKPSLIIPQMSEGAQSRVTRGFPQMLALNPANYSINPDDADDMVSRFKYLSATHKNYTNML